MTTYVTDLPLAPPPSRVVGFGAAIILFFKNYFQFQGRSSRGAFWWFVVWNFIATVGLMALVLGAAFGEDASLFGWVFGFVLFVSFVVFVPTVALCVRRLHDIGRSGWWYLTYWIPGVGALLMLIWSAQPGQRGRNQFGPDIEAGRR